MTDPRRATQGRRLRSDDPTDTIEPADGADAPPREGHAIPTDDKATLLANAILDKKGEDVVLLDVAELVGYADHFLLATGTSAPHLDAMTEALTRAGKSAGFAALGVEGKGSQNWVLLDFGDVLVHLFSREGRGFYDLDGLWCDAPRTVLSDEADAGLTFGVGR